MSYNYDDLSLSEIRDILRQWRETNERKSDEVVEFWIAVLEDNLDKLDNEKFIIVEQALIAALDCHNYSVVDSCIRVLSAEFPGSLRILRYKAARLEGLEKYKEAFAILDTIIHKDPTNSAARKRRIAILKAQGNITEAISQLVSYLSKFMSDLEGWQELCELYLQVQEYSKAAFCSEELLLHQPHSHLFHQKVADIRYTMGGVDNLELAKSHYCHVLKLNPENLRALLGLFLTTNKLMGIYKSSGTANKRKEAWKLHQWAQQKVSRKYRDSGATGPLVTREEVPSLDAMLLSLSIGE